MTTWDHPSDGHAVNRMGAQRPNRAIVAVAAILVCFGLRLAGPAVAQQAGSHAQPAKPAASRTAAAKPVAAKPESGGQEGDAGLRQRVEQLEEQLVEMQVTVGTLDSLAKGGASSSSGVYRGSGTDGSAGGADAGRIAVLETQVRALANQVDQLSQALRQANVQAAAAPRPAVGAANGALPVVAAIPDMSDPIGRLVNNGRPAGAAAVGRVDTPVANSMALAGASDASSKEAYEAAYGSLLQQDFASAEAAFGEFLKRYPSDPLAGNAQYWLGETYFARGLYKPAASAFLKGYQTYARSPKAPDSVLKLALSLDKLGQKDAACASYAELAVKFPNAPGHIKNRADTERRRLGCS